MLRIQERLTLKFHDVEAALDAALAIASDASKAYLRANPEIRRLMNQAIFERLDIDQDGNPSGQLAEPFATLYEVELLAGALDRPSDPQEDEDPGLEDPGSVVDLVTASPFDVGSISDKVVGAAGFEPATSRV